MESPKDLKKALDAWQQRRASVEEVRSLAADLGNQHYAAGIPTLLQLLSHEDDIVRYNAANSLAFEFRHMTAAEKLMSMLAHDQDDDCRRVGAAALGNLFQNSKNPRVLTSLAEAALKDADEYVRSSAYKALQIVNGVSRDEHLELLRSENLAVDATRVCSIMGEISR
jgi:HEAT repeat protein